MTTWEGLGRRRGVRPCTPHPFRHRPSRGAAMAVPILEPLLAGQVRYLKESLVYFAISFLDSFVEIMAHPAIGLL